MTDREDAQDAVQVQVLVDHAQGAYRLGLARVLIRPGGRTACITHRRMEEVWCVIRGQARFYRQAEGASAAATADLLPGDAVFVPPGYRCWIENVSSDDFVFFSCGSPPWQDGREGTLWDTQHRSNGATAAGPVPKPTPQGERTMPDRFEYKILVSDSDDETDEETLNGLGDQGWELVNAVADVRANEESGDDAEGDDQNVPVTVFYFKRRKEQGMSILVDKDTKVIVQGITGREGEFHTQQMLAYGTQVVGGVTPGKGGQTVQGVPVFDTVQDAVTATGANASCIFVPARFAADGILEAADAGVDFIVCITEGIPIEDEIRAVNVVKISKSRLLGPNCPGILTVGACKIGIIPSNIFRPGPIGIVSRSGTLTYESVDALTRAGLGQTTCVGVGGDPMPGTRFIDVLPLFEADPQTEAVVMCGEVGGSDEEIAAEYIKTMTKPVVGFIAGLTAPPGKRMGHAGAIISGTSGGPQAKVDALRAAGVRMAESTADIPGLIKEALGH